MHAPLLDLDGDEGAGQGRVTNEVHGTVLSRAPSELHAPFFTRPFHEDFFALPNPGSIASKLNGLLQFQQDIEALGLHRLRDLLLECYGFSAGPW
jgi:hypothetical protein